MIYSNVEYAHKLFQEGTSKVWGKIELQYVGLPEKVIQYELEAVKPS